MTMTFVFFEELSEKLQWSRSWIDAECLENGLSSAILVCKFGRVVECFFACFPGWQSLTNYRETFEALWKAHMEPRGLQVAVSFSLNLWRLWGICFLREFELLKLHGGFAMSFTFRFVVMSFFWWWLGSVFFFRLKWVGGGRNVKETENLSNWMCFGKISFSFCLLNEDVWFTLKPAAGHWQYGSGTCKMDAAQRKPKGQNW